MHRLDDYQEIAGAPAIDELRSMAAPLAGRRLEMVMTEAMSCGTPVVARPKGAAPRGDEFQRRGDGVPL